MRNIIVKLDITIETFKIQGIPGKVEKIILELELFKAILEFKLSLIKLKISVQG